MAHAHLLVDGLGQRALKRRAAGAVPRLAVGAVDLEGHALQVHERELLEDLAVQLCQNPVHDLMIHAEVVALANVLHVQVDAQDVLVGGHDLHDGAGGRHVAEGREANDVRPQALGGVVRVLAEVTRGNGVRRHVQLVSAAGALLVRHDGGDLAQPRGKLVERLAAAAELDGHGHGEGVVHAAGRDAEDDGAVQVNGLVVGVHGGPRAGEGADGARALVDGAGVGELLGGAAPLALDERLHLVVGRAQVHALEVRGRFKRLGGVAADRRLHVHGGAHGTRRGHRRAGGRAVQRQSGHRRVLGGHNSTAHVSLCLHTRRAETHIVTFFTLQPHRPTSRLT